MTRTIQGTSTATMLLSNVLLILLTGCVKPQTFTESVAKFSSATATLANGAEQFLTETDTANLEASLFRAKYGGSAIDKQQMQNPLFPPNDMAARKAGLATLQQYAAGLSKAAGTTLGEDFRAEVQRLKDDILSLSDKVGKMTDTTDTLKNLEKETGVIATLVGTIGQIIIEEKQAEVLVDTVLQAAPHLLELSNMLEKDMELVFAKLENVKVLKFAAIANNFNIRACAAPETLTDDEVCKVLKTACQTETPQPYHCERLESGIPFPQQERSELVDIADQSGREVAAQRQVRLQFNQTLGGFKKALRDLAAFARAERDLQKLPGVIAAVDLFIVRAQSLYNAVQDLVAIRA